MYGMPITLGGLPNKDSDLGDTTVEEAKMLDTLFWENPPVSMKAERGAETSTAETKDSKRTMGVTTTCYK